MDSPPDSKEANQKHSTAFEAEDTSSGPHSGRFTFYCWLACLSLCLFVVRITIGLTINDSIVALDFYCLGQDRHHFLITALCLTVYAVFKSLIFIVSNDESCSQARRAANRGRVEVFCLILFLSVIAAISTATYLTINVVRSSNKIAANSSVNRSYLSLVLVLLLGHDIFWAFYALCIAPAVLFYFSVSCAIVETQFQSIGDGLDGLSGSSWSDDDLSTLNELYIEYLEACQMLKKSNKFWKFIIGTTLSTYAPAFVQCSYVVLRNNFDFWANLFNWLIIVHTGLTIMMILAYAVGVSAKTRAPVISLKRLLLSEPPPLVASNIKSYYKYLHNLTFGYSCLLQGLVITRASILSFGFQSVYYSIVIVGLVFTLISYNADDTMSTEGAGIIDDDIFSKLTIAI